MTQPKQSSLKSDIDEWLAKHTLDLLPHERQELRHLIENIGIEARIDEREYWKRSMASYAKKYPDMTLAEYLKNMFEIKPSYGVTEQLRKGNK